MKGVIKTYLPEKKYGFIKGDDGKDYFFHDNEFRNGNQVRQLCEAAFVSFDQEATPKGYKARNCSLINPADVLTYALPEEFIASRSDSVRGLEVLEHGNWIVHGTSRDSPDAAKRNAMERAAAAGANALVGLEYYKSTGSEAGTGRGTHHFTIHNFRGRVMTVARRTAAGRYRADQLSGLNQRAELLKAKLVEQTRASQRKQGFVWAGVVVLSLLSMYSAPGAIILWLVLGFIFGRSTDHDSWLERA